MSTAASADHGAAAVLAAEPAPAVAPKRRRCHSGPKGDTHRRLGPTPGPRAQCVTQAGTRELTSFRLSWLSTPALLGPVERKMMGQIGEPIRRYTVVPLEEPVSPTPERVAPPHPSRSPEKSPPVTKPEPQPAE